MLAGTGKFENKYKYYYILDIILLYYICIIISYMLYIRFVLLCIYVYFFTFQF